MDTSNNTKISKLVLLYFFDNMEIPLTENTIVESCCSKNQWINYITCREIMIDLVDTGFVLKTTKNKEDYYSITGEGRDCLSYFFAKIPTSLRDEISSYVKENRIMFKRKQEYRTTYEQNTDGSYLVILRIVEPLGTQLELKINVANRKQAKDACKRWEEKASEVYASIYNILIDD